MRTAALFMLLLLTPTAFAQSSKLTKLEGPVAMSIAGYDRAHCVAVSKQIRVCKTLSDEKDTFLIERAGQVVGTWPGTVYMAETSDFEVLTGDLNNDQQSELVVANHDGTSNGMGVDYWTIFIFPDTEFQSFKAPLTFSVEEYGSFGTFVSTGRNVDILTTTWVWNSDPKHRRGWGTYLVGQWWRYDSGELRPLLNRPIIARRYLNSFEKQRLETTQLDRVPNEWLRHPTTETVSTAFITKKIVQKRSGVIQEVVTDPKSAQLKITFKPDGEQPVTLLYPFNEGDSRLDLIGDERSGRLYPNHYLPSQPEGWLKDKRAIVRTYEDQGLRVLWLDR